MALPLKRFVWKLMGIVHRLWKNSLFKAVKKVAYPGWISLILSCYIAACAQTTSPGDSVPSSPPVTPTQRTFETSPTNTPQKLQGQATEKIQPSTPSTSPTVALSQKTRSPENTRISVPTKTPTTVPCDRAAFLAHVTVPDGQEMKPGQVFTKTWRLKNLGTCTWDSGYSLVFDSGFPMNSPSEIPLTSGQVRPGENVEVSVELTAPLADHGILRSNWKLQNNIGGMFGLGNNAGPLWVSIFIPMPTPTHTLTGTVTLTPLLTSTNSVITPTLIIQTVTPSP